MGDRRPARPPGRGRARRRVRRPAGRLHDVPRLRRGRAPLGPRARGHARGAAPRRPRDRPHRRARPPSAPRPYELVVLSDHGQTQGATFLQRYGETLEQLVARACATDDVRAESSGEDEAMGRIGAALTEASGAETAGGRAVARRHARPRGRRRGPGRRGRGDGDGRELPEISVMASGCLGLITFPRLPGRVTHEQIDAALPGPLGRAAPASRDRLRARRRRRPRCRAAGATCAGATATHRRGSARALRAERGRPRRPHRRLRALPRHPRQQHLVAGHRGGRGVRGARRLARRDGWPAVASRSCWRRAPPAPRRRRSSVPSRCTASCAAGWPTSATTPTDEDHVARARDRA